MVSGGEESGGKISGVSGVVVSGVSGGKRSECRKRSGAKRREWW